MIKRLVLPFALMLFVGGDLCAQKTQAIYPQWSLRTNLFSWADADAGIMLGLNYRWSEKFSASVEPSFLFFTLLMRDGQGNIVHPLGYKIRSDYRYHFPKKRRHATENFIGLEFHYKNVRYDRQETFGINCENGNCAYYQQAWYKEIKNEIGGAFKAGLITPVSRNARWMLEIYAGLGVKYMTFKVSDLPIGASFQDPPQRLFPDIQLSDFTSDEFYYPLVPAGIKLLFRL